MKIAIPSNDNITISQHFGKTKGFVICEIENDKVVKKNMFKTLLQSIHRGYILQRAMNTRVTATPKY